MTTFEIAKNILRILVVNAAETMVYDCWSDEFATKNVRGTVNQVIKCEWFLPIDPNEFTVEELKQLDFRRWSRESELWLIPLWLRPFLADMFIYAAIDEEPKMGAAKDIDNDHRFGCLAYGVVKHEQE